MSVSVSPFRPCFLKIERAQQHIAELAKLAQEYLAYDPVRYTVVDHPQADRPGDLIVSFKVEFSPMPPAPENMSVIIGDIFHNLRSALDLMASTLAVLNNKSPDDVYFPFASSENDLGARIKDKRFNRAGPEAIKLLLEFRPFKGGNLELRAIHDLNIRDKHQELIVQKPQVTATGPIIDTRPEGGSRFKVLKDTERSNVALLFPDDCALAGKDLLVTLHDLVELTAGIVKAFEALRAPAG